MSSVEAVGLISSLRLGREVGRHYLVPSLDAVCQVIGGSWFDRVSNLGRLVDMLVVPSLDSVRQARGHWFHRVSAIR